MTTETQAPARPDLTGLTWTQWLSVCVEECRGAKWEMGEWIWVGHADYWRLQRGEETLAMLNDRLVWQESQRFTLPNYPGDSAAWGALQDAERIDVAYNEFIEGVGPYVLARHRPIQFWDHAKETGEAVSLATLRKHNHPDLTALLENRP